MIKEEAIEILSDMRAEYNIFSDDEEEATRYHALSWAIQALNEQQRTGRWKSMSDDLISKKAAIDATWFEPSYTDPLNVLTEVRDRLEALPSAQPGKICVANVTLTDEQVREAVEKAKNSVLTVIESERKKGKWIVHMQRGNWNDEEIRTCPECGKTFRNLDVANYCPNCGLPMEMEAEE